MENASKALLIAGGVLLAIIILSIGIILYNSFSNTTVQYAERLNATELAKFNANFEVFKGRTDITAQEIASLINIVVEYKKKTSMSVEISVDGTFYGESNDTVEFLKDNLYNETNEKFITFKFESIEYNSKGEINSIKFETVR